MVEERTIDVGFYSHFGTFRQSGRSKTPLKPTIINGIPFNPTYAPTRMYLPSLYLTTRGGANS